MIVPKNVVTFWTFRLCVIAIVVLVSAAHEDKPKKRSGEYRANNIFLIALPCDFCFP